MCRSILALAALLLLSSHPAVSQKSDSTIGLRPSPPGKLVNIGGYRLHINCKGKGGPTVVLEAGAGDFSFDWGLVQPGVARFTRVCSYDRSGYAWSDAGPMPRTLQQIAAELHLVLRKSREKGPYVLVGHSLGGLIVREYAMRYAKEVAGVVLVDSSHEDNQIMLNNKLTLLRKLSRGRPIPPVRLKMTNPAKSGARSSVRKPLAPVPTVDAPFNKLPTNLQKLRLWAIIQPNYSEARSSEFDFLAEETALMHAERSKTEHPLGDMPLIVLSRGENASERHQKLQADLVRLSRSGRQMVAQKSDHHIQLDDPALVIEAIKEVVDAARH